MLEIYEGKLGAWKAEAKKLKAELYAMRKVIVRKYKNGAPMKAKDKRDLQAIGERLELCNVSQVEPVLLGGRVVIDYKVLISLEKKLKGFDFTVAEYPGRIVINYKKPGTEGEFVLYTLADDYKYFVLPLAKFKYPTKQLQGAV